jgi:hypothetical protein
VNACDSPRVLVRSRDGAEIDAALRAQLAALGL